MRKFMRTRAPPSPSPPPPPSPPHSPPHSPLPPRDTPALNGHAHKNNGYANGGGARDDRHSSLSRYWSGSEASGALFEDAAFPPARALGDARLARSASWPRPHELCARPRFRGDDGADESPDELAERWSVQAGAAGDPHVSCAAAALAPTPRLLDRAAPPQTFRKRYTGAFRFRFWVFGEWREVVVDDRLPARGSRLLGSRAARDDYTLPLLEKAYAKLHGSYAALRGGSVARALQELSGGIVQSFSLRVQARALTFQVLNSGVPRSTLLVATAPPGAPGGLLPARPYAVSGLARVRGAAGGAAGALVRLRAATGRGAWRGAWAPDSAEWRALAPPDRELLAPRADRPGDFWMSFEDFARCFSQLELLHVGPDDWLLERGLHAKRPWRAVLARRRWRAGYNAGGPPACQDTTGTNPQFHVQIPHSEAAGARKCHVVVSVTQQYDVGAAARKLRAIGFAVYELGPGGPRRPSDHAALRGLRPLDVTHESRAREVVTFFTLPPGRYLVVPHTRRPHTDAAFLLRILTDELTDVWCVPRCRVSRPRGRSRSPTVCPQGGERGQPDRARRGGGVPRRRGRHPGAGARGLRTPARGGRAGRGGAARGAAARVARLPVRAAVAAAVPRAGAAARRGAERRHARARRAGAGGAAGLLARRLPEARRAALRRHGVLVVPTARAAVGGRRDGQQQGAGVPGAALRPRRRAHGGGVRDGAGAPAPRARAVPQPRHQDEVQPALPGRDDPDDDLLVRRRRRCGLRRPCSILFRLFAV